MNNLLKNYSRGSWFHLEPLPFPSPNIHLQATYPFGGDQYYGELLKISNAWGFHLNNTNTVNVNNTLGQLWTMKVCLYEYLGIYNSLRIRPDLDMRPIDKIGHKNLYQFFDKGEEQL